MKKTLKISAAILTLSAISSLAIAATPGAYVGGGLGYGRLDTPDHNLATGQGSQFFSQSHERTGLGEKAFAGYNFNQYFGIEGGYAHYAKAHYKSSFKPNTKINSSVDYYLQDVNLVGKAYLPIYDSGFSLYALGGAAYVISKTDATLNGVTSTLKSTSVTTKKLRPTYGIGASYDIPQTQLTTSLEFSRVQGKGNVSKSSSAIPSANLVAFNLAYNFG